MSVWKESKRLVRCVSIDFCFTFHVFTTWRWSRQNLSFTTRIYVSNSSQFCQVGENPKDGNLSIYKGFQIFNEYNKNKKYLKVLYTLHHHFSFCFYLLTRMKIKSRNCEKNKNLTVEYVIHTISSVRSDFIFILFISCFFITNHYPPY